MSDRHDWERGYHDGLSGKDYPMPSAMDIVLGAIMPGVDPAGPSDDYDDGYKEGREDREKK